MGATTAPGKPGDGMGLQPNEHGRQGVPLRIAKCIPHRTFVQVKF